MTKLSERNGRGESRRIVKRTVSGKPPVRKEVNHTVQPLECKESVAMQVMSWFQVFVLIVGFALGMFIALEMWSVRMEKRAVGRLQQLWQALEEEVQAAEKAAEMEILENKVFAPYPGEFSVFEGKETIEEGGMPK